MTIRREFFILISNYNVRALMCVRAFVHIIIVIFNILYTLTLTPIWGDGQLNSKITIIIIVICHNSVITYYNLFYSVF